jgi:hypothetical protein
VSDDDGRTPDPAGSVDLLDLADAMRSLADRATEADGRPALQELVRISIERVPRARWASLTILRGGHFTTEASTDDVATRADALQYELGSGPCVDAVLDESVYVTDDASCDLRWPEWGRRVHAEMGVSSVLSQRLTLLDESGAIAGLNIYSDQPDAFDDRAVGTGLVLSTHGSLLVTAMLARGRATNLLRALETNREIGVAMGILMQRHSLTREQAFDVLRVASQDSNRKLSAVASDVADTGTLAIQRWPRTALGVDP